MDVGGAAAWRSHPKSHGDNLLDIRNRGKQLSALLQLPYFSIPVCCRMDWLHVADQGVAADLAGNLFWYVQRLEPGRNLQTRVAAMNIRLQKFYDDNHVADRIDLLHVNRFWESRKLRCSAACMRAMVPFLVQLADHFLSDADAVELALKLCCRALHQCYLSLDERSFLHADVAHAQSIIFASNWVALHRYWHDSDKNAFKLKPKLHLFLHICSDGSRPRRYWAYRDEDYGGSVARRGRRRGGVLSVSALSRRVLDRFWLQFPNFRMT